MLRRLVLLAAVLLGLPSSAFQLRKDSQGEVVRWARQVEFVIDAELAEVLEEGKADAAIKAAIAVLAAATPAFDVKARVGRARAIGYQVGASDNQNDVVALEEWPYDDNALAATIVTLNARTNEIIDADVVFNAEDFQFRVVDALSEAERRSERSRLDDIQNTVTHELGHALGLLHNEADPAVVMYPSAAPQEISKRVLAEDDRAGLIALYAAGLVPPSLESLLGCSSTTGAPTVLAALALAGLALRRRRAALLLALAPMVALAEEPRAPGGPDLVAAEEISVAEVKARRSFRLDDRPGLIFTDVELVVRECVKGPCGATRVVRVPGGRVGDLEQVVAHQPVPVVEERVLYIQGARRPRLVRVEAASDRLLVDRAFSRAGLVLPVSLRPQSSPQPLTGPAQAPGSTR